MRWQDINQPLHFKSQGHWRLKSLFSYIDEEVSGGFMDLDPSFQRGRVWTKRQQELFVGHLLEGGAVAPIVFSTIGDETIGVRVLLDGKQRLGAIRAFVDGKICAEMANGERAYLSDFEDSDRLLRGVHVVLGFAHLSPDPKVGWAETLKLYIKLNRGGTPHTEAEIDKVRAMLAEVNDDHQD